MRYRYLNVRINSVIDAAISCKNFVNFSPVTPENTLLIRELFVRHGKQEGLAVASIARDVGSSSTNRSSDIMHFLPKLLKKTLQHERL